MHFCYLLSNWYFSIPPCKVQLQLKLFFGFEQNQFAYKYGILCVDIYIYVFRSPLLEII